MGAFKVTRPTERAPLRKQQHFYQILDRFLVPVVSGADESRVQSSRRGSPFLLKPQTLAQNPHSCDSSDRTVRVDHSRTRTRCMTLYVPANVHLAAPKRSRIR